MPRKSRFIPHNDLIKTLLKKHNNITKVATIMAAKLGVESTDTFRRTLSKYASQHVANTTKVMLIEHGEHYKKALSHKVVKSNFYGVTSAQNATPINEKLLKNIEAYLKFLGGELIVIPLRYKNPTSTFTTEHLDKWHEKVVPYLNAKRQRIHPKLVVIGDVKIQPTVSMPLQGKELMSGLDSCIIGHPRVHLRSTPRLPSYDPKVMITTGSVTVPNYTDSNAGKIGEAHHTYGFVIVEVKDNNIFYMRNVTANADGSFTDLYYTVENGVVFENKEVEAIILGDIHVGKHDQVVLDEIEKMVIKPLKPKHVILNDISDMYSVRKHDMKDAVKEYIAMKKATNNIQKELDSIFTFCEKWINYNLVIVRSNHDEHLDQYIVSQDWKKDVTNAITYNKLALLLLEEKAPKGLLPHLLDEKFKGKVKTLGIQDSFRVLGWEAGFHGHLGVNGARGSNASFKKLSTKMIKGHDHTVFREDGCLSTGTCTQYDLGYNKGLTNWLQGATIIHKDSKAQQLMVIKGKFTTFELPA